MVDQPKAEESMKDRSSGNSTNELLAQILAVDQQILAATQGNSQVLQQSLQVQQDSKVLLQQLVTALTGEGGTHTFTVLVQQLADKIGAKLRK